MEKKISIIGGGLAGSEAAYTIARAGYKVDLYEMKPVKFSLAHSNEIWLKLFVVILLNLIY